MDEDGTPTRVRIIASFDGVAINEANGKTAQLQQVLVVFVDLETGEVVWDGLRMASRCAVRIRLGEAWPAPSSSTITYCYDYQ